MPSGVPVDPPCCSPTCTSVWNPVKNTDQSDFRSIFGPLWARKWLIAIVAIICAVGTYAYYNREPRVYSSATQLFLGKTSDVALADVQSQSAAEGDRDLANKATLIRSRRIGALV